MVTVPSSSRDIVLSKQAALKARNAGFGSHPSADPFQHRARDGTPFLTYPEMVVYESSQKALQLGDEEYKRKQARMYRRA